MALLNRYVSSSGSATAGGSTPGSPLVTGASWTASGTTVTATGIGGSGVAVNDRVYLTGATGGYATNWFTITAVTDADNVVIHTAPGASGTDWAVGGAITLGTCFSTAQPGDIWWIKADGTYARGTTGDAPASGTAAAPIYYVGYASTPGDGFQGWNADGTLVTTNFATITYTSGSISPGTGKINCVFENLNISCSGKAGGVFGMASTNAAFLIYHCKITNSTNSASAYVYGASSGGSHRLIECDLACSGAASAQVIVGGQTGNPLVVSGCRITSGGASPGIQTTGASNSLVAFGNTIFNCTAGIYIAGTSSNTANIFYNTIHGCAAGIRTGNAALTQGGLAMANMITDCGIAIDSLYSGTGDQSFWQILNRTRDNTNPNAGFPNSVSWGEVTTDTGNAATDYLDAGSTDFRLVRTSPGVEAGSRYSSIGAFQRPANLPAASDVKSGTTYGGYANNDLTGSYVGGGGGGGFIPSAIE